MAFVDGLGLDRTAFEEVSQFAVDCHKIILLYRSPVDSHFGLLLLRTCIGPVWFCHSSATLASNTFRSWYSPRLGWLYPQPRARRAPSAPEWVDSGLTYFLYASIQFEAIACC